MWRKKLPWQLDVKQLSLFCPKAKFLLTNKLNVTRLLYQTVRWQVAAPGPNFVKKTKKKPTVAKLHLTFVCCSYHTSWHSETKYKCPETPSLA